MKRPFFIITSSIIIGLFFAASTYAATAARTLSLGMSGSDVTELQSKLISLGYLASGKNTGYFGPLTDTALKKFQCDKSIICTNATVSGYGLYGPKTRATLVGLTASVSLAPGMSSSTTSTTVSSAPWKGKLEFSGWIPYWRKEKGVEDTLPHMSQLSSVMPFGFTMKSDGTLADTAKINEEPWKTLIAEAKKKGVRVVPTVMWGDGDAIHAVLSDATKRVALEDEIAKVVKDNGFDGIDIDFEAKKHETKDYFSTFLKGLYQRMGKKWVYCTVEARMPLSHRYLPGQTIPADATDYANDYAEMNKYCDRVEIMAYDQGYVDKVLNKARSAPYAPVADPAWVENLVELAAQSIDRKKIVIGVPTYGYEYSVTPTSSGSYLYKMLWAFNYKYATDIAGKLGITPARTSANEIGFSYDPARLAAVAPQGDDATGTQQALAGAEIVGNTGATVDTSKPFNFLSWSDAQAIKDKVNLAKKLGVRGVAVFKFDGGEDMGMWEVLK
ncbi:MAG: hypothetical protein HGA67_03490 [Candidatus Yonathbacteria bacterium]|nr:hypothetical protein [Candidatus Yonathbacteria bacterium]